MKLTFRTSAALGAALLALTAAGCGGSDAGTHTEGELEVMLSYKKSIAWLPLLVAEERGYFDEEGVKISLEATSGSGFVTQQVLADNVIVGWAGAPDVAVAYSRDSDIRSPMCNLTSNIFRIVVPQDSDIEEVADLKGKTLGIAEAGGGEEPIVNAPLKDAGLERDVDVAILPIGDAGPASLNAILDGKVDAYAGSYPDISTLTADGRLVTRDITPSAYDAIPGDCLVTTKDHLADEGTRKDILGMARAWARGAVFAAAHPDEALEIACRQVPQECEDMDFARQYLEDTIALFGDIDGAVYGAVPLDAWETTIAVLRDSGAIGSDVNAEDLGAGEDIRAFVEEYSDFDAAALRAGE